MNDLVRMQIRHASRSSNGNLESTVGSQAQVLVVGIEVLGFVVDQVLALVAVHLVVALNDVGQAALANVLDDDAEDRIEASADEEHNVRVVQLAEVLDLAAELFERLLLVLHTD